jgi:hypothetical protein
MPVNKSIMKMSVLGLSALPIITLAACGEGYEVKPYYGVPYTDERTAGHGVEWVRASMLPPKEMKTETVTKVETKVEAPVTPPPPAPAIADKVFKNSQSK